MGRSCFTCGMAALAGLLLMAMAATAAVAAPCAHPVLQPGQEKAIAAMFELPGGAGQAPMVPTEIAVTSQGMAVTYADRWAAKAGDQPLRYRVQRLVAQAQLADDEGPDVHVERLAPCPLHATATAAGCEAADRLARLGVMDTRVQAALFRSWETLAWRCPADEGQAPPLRTQLAAVHAALAAAQLPEAERLLSALLNSEPPAARSLAEQVDVATAVQQVRGQQGATALFRAAVDQWRQQPGGGPWSERGRADLERVAAAYAALGEREAGRAALASCWREHAGPKTCMAGPLAAALESRGDWEGASALLDEELRRRQPAPAELWLARISLAGRHNDAETELATAEAANRTWPDDPQLQRSLAAAHFRNGEHGPALALLDAQFKQGHERHRLLALIEGIYCDMGRSAQVKDGSLGAFRSLDKGLQARAAHPEDLVARFLVGVRQLREGHLEAALVTMSAVQIALPKATRPLVYMAVAQHWNGRHEAARAAIERAIGVDADDPAAHHARAAILAGHDALAARQSLERYLALASQPGRLQFSDQLHQAQAALARLERGETPAAPLRPGERPRRPTAHSLADPMRLPGPVPLGAGLALLLAGGGLGWWWRSRAS